MKMLWKLKKEEKREYLKMSNYFILQKSGYIYAFNNYKDVTVEIKKDLPELIELLVQHEPKQHYKRIGLLAQTILLTNVEEIQKYISEINVRRRGRTCI